MNVSKIKITSKSNSSNYKEFEPAEYKIDYDSLAGPQSGRSIDGSMNIDWILRKITKLEVTLPPHKFDDATYSYIAQLIQGQVVKVDFFDYLSQTKRTNVEMYCSQISAGYSYKGMVMDVSFELIEMTGENAWNIPTITLYTVSLSAGTGGSATGGGEYTEDTWITLQAIPDEHYRFVAWNDGSTQNPRPYLVTDEDVSFSATFRGVPVTLSVGGDHCSTTGSGTYYYGDTVTISCVPNTNYEFVSWNDGNTSNPRTVTVTGNTSYYATTQGVSVTLSASGSNCSFTGTGTYRYGDTATLTCIPDELYRFVEWNDGVTDNPRTVVMTGNKSYTATTQHTRVYLTVEGDNCTTSGSGWYNYGDTATVTATPNSGYEFFHWSDDNVNSTRTIYMDGNKTLTAYMCVDVSDTYLWVKFGDDGSSTTYTNSPFFYHTGNYYPSNFEYEASPDGINWYNCVGAGSTIGAFKKYKHKKIYLRSSLSGTSYGQYGDQYYYRYTFVGYENVSGTGRIEAIGGPLMSFVDPGYSQVFQFQELCAENPYLIDASELILPNSVAPYCYHQMFMNCTNLTGVPALPATNLGNAPYCYAGMFNGCASLTSASVPTLPATQLSERCYDSMFRRCTSLIAPPVFTSSPIIMSQYCFAYMFYNCTSLTSVPSINYEWGETIYARSFYYMFYNCTSLTQLLSISDIKYFNAYCCAYMYRGCSSIKISETQTSECPNAFVIPTPSSQASTSLDGMFNLTGGTFVGTPNFGNTYYTNATVV